MSRASELAESLGLTLQALRKTFGQGCPGLGGWCNEFIHHRRPGAVAFACSHVSNFFGQNPLNGEVNLCIPTLKELGRHLQFLLDDGFDHGSASPDCTTSTKRR